MPDFSIFQTMPHKLYLDQAIFLFVPVSLGNDVGICGCARLMLGA